MTDIVSVPASGLALHARVDRGPPGAPWLLFSNSLVTDLSIWDRQVEAFAERYNIMRYDQRGHGRTGVPALAPTFEDLADDVVRIASAVGVERFTYIGLSMGVPTGLRLFATRPDLIERLVLCDGGAATTVERGKLWAERIAAVRRDGMGPFTAETMARWFSPPFLASPDAETIRAVMAGTAVEGFAACATALQAYDYAAVVPGIDVPTLLIAGALDGEVPKSMRRLADAIANSVFVEIPEAGHIPNAEQPAAFNAALSEFLARS